MDLYEDKAFISLVAFLFQDAKLFGRIPLWPFATFEEINLRFYVLRKAPDGARRAVTFIREIVPFRAIASAARFLYNEPYLARPMKHRWEFQDLHKPECGGRFSYEWKESASWIGISAETHGPLLPLRQDSEEEFILEHFWGYTRQRDGATMEYRVAHPAWKYWATVGLEISPGVKEFYGTSFREALAKPPRSAFIAEGSEVSVFRGQRISGP